MKINKEDIKTILIDALLYVMGFVFLWVGTLELPFSLQQCFQIVSPIALILAILGTVMIIGSIGKPCKDR